MSIHNCNNVVLQDLQWKYDFLLVDEGDLFEASLPLQEKLEKFLHRPPQHVDETNRLVVHHLHGPGHQTEASQYLPSLYKKKTSEKPELSSNYCLQVKELDSVISSTEFDIPMFIQEHDMSINGLRYYQP